MDRKEDGRSSVSRLRMLVLVALLTVSLLTVVVVSIDGSDETSAGGYFDFEKDGFRFAILDDPTEVSVVGCTLSGHVIVPETVENNGTTYTVVSLGLTNHSIMGTNVSSVELNKNIRAIKPHTFSGATGLKFVTNTDNVVDVGNSAFKGCESLMYIELPATTVIYDATFMNCTSMISVSIPHVEEIYMNAFEGCSSLRDLELGSSLRIMTSYVFSGCSALKSVELPDSLEEIGKECFAGCSSLETLKLSTNPKFTKIPYSAFTGCSSLKMVSIPDNIIELEENSFGFCTNLSTVAFGIGVKLEKIGVAAFQECGFHHFKIPHTVTSVFSNSFYLCSGLEKIEVEEGNERYMSDDGILFAKDSDGEPSTLVSYPMNKSGADYAISNSVSSIGSFSFANNKHLVSVRLSDTLTEVQERAFSSCKKLESVLFGLSVSVIGKYAFWDCEHLEEVVLGESVRSIGDHAFAQCESMVMLDLNEGLEHIEKSAFSGCTGLTFVGIPNSVISVGPQAFSKCTSVTYLQIGSRLAEVDDTAFDYMPSLKEIIMDPHNPNLTVYDGALYSGDYKTLYLYPAASTRTHFVFHQMVETVSKQAFTDCRFLERVTIGANVEDMWTSTPFNNCPSLEAIDVNGNNKSFKSIDGILISIHMVNQSIVQYPMGKKDTSFDFSGSRFNDVTRTSPYAFMGNPHLEKVVLPNNLSMCSLGVFYNCVSLREVIFPETTLSIGMDCFVNCPFIEHVYVPELAEISSSDFITEGYVYDFYTDKERTDKFSDYECLSGHIYIVNDANTYSVALDANGGVNGKSSITVQYWGYYGDLGTPERDGYTFVGWYTERHGGTEVHTGDRVNVSTGHTLYAHWVKMDETVDKKGHEHLVIGCIAGGLTVILAAMIILRRRS